MAVATELSAGDQVGAFLRRGERHGDAESGHGVLLGAHRVDGESVDHVHRADVEDDRLVVRDHDVVVDDEVVLAQRIRLVQAKFVRREELDVAPAEFSVESGIAGIPSELLADDPKRGGLVLLREVRRGLRPKRDGEPDQQHRFDQGDHAFEIGRDVALHADIVRLGVRTGAKLHHAIEEVDEPTHEQRRHQHVDVDEELVNSGPLAGGVGRRSWEIDLVHV